MPILTHNVSSDLPNAPDISGKIPGMMMHGVFLEIKNKGVLLTGPAGIGKSTCALALLQRGHRLIADDCPIFYSQDQQLIGVCPPALKDLLYVRSKGLIDVRHTFGKNAILTQHPLELVIEFIPVQKKKIFFRPHRKLKMIAGHRINQLTFLLDLNNNMAILVESAVRLAFTTPSSKIER